MGGEIGSRAIVGRPSKNNSAKCPLFPIGVDTAKDLLFSRFKISNEGPGYIHFSDHLPDEFFKQLTAEKVVTRYHKGYSKRTFVKIRPRNESLDCMVYALAAYSILGVNVNAIAAKIDESKHAVAEESEAPAPVSRIARPGRGGRKGGFVNNWR